MRWHPNTIAFLIRGLCNASMAEDQIQVINSAWEWPDQGIGYMDPNGDTVGGAIVRDMIIFQNRLVVAGSFFYAGGMDFSHIALWNGKGWSSLDSAFPSSSVRDVLELDGVLYAGGVFNKVGELQVNGLASWDGNGWSALGSGTGTVVTSLALWDDGAGLALYAGGSFPQRLKKWDGIAWTPLGGCSGTVTALTVYDDGAGPALFVAASPNCGAPGGIAKWDGDSWSALGQGITQGLGLNTLAVYDDGTGEALYVGGRFTEVDGQSIMNIARWNGKTWSAVGNPSLQTWDEIQRLKVLDDGSGPALYAIGGSVLQKWDGRVWKRYLPNPGPLMAIEVFPGADGQPTLHVGGEISFMVGDPPQRVHKNIARWVAPPAPGCKSADFDGDGAITQADLGILLAAFNCPGPGCQGDADGDGDTDQADLGILLANFGQKCG